MAPATTPAFNTWSKTTAQVAMMASPAQNTRSHHVSHIPKCKPTLAKCMVWMKKDVQHALAVMDTTTGNLLNYRQLIQHHDYHANWTKSSANEFGQLANGVGGLVKGTNTIKFMYKQDIPHNRLRGVTYGQFVCTI
jgi:hypothetical protein